MRNKIRIMPPINKQTSFELMFGYDGIEPKKAKKALVYERSKGKLNGQSI